MLEGITTVSQNEHFESTHHDALVTKENFTVSSIASLKTPRDNRSSESSKMKDEQIRILTEQNTKLLDALEKAEEGLSTLQLEKKHTDDLNRELREANFKVNSKAKVNDSEIERLQSEQEDREHKLHVVTAQHEKLLKLLESEEIDNERISSQFEAAQSELRTLKVNYATLMNEANESKRHAEEYFRKNQLNNEEILLIRSENDNLKTRLQEETMKASVEIESLQEQLRVRKEKQYKLLEKLQTQEETRLKTEDQVANLEDKIKNLISKSSSTEVQLQIEMNSKLGQVDANQKLKAENDALQEQNKELILSLSKIEKENIRIEEELRNNGEQLREMAEKVFQLLERLKLAELGKTRSMDALRSKEDEVRKMKKKLTDLTNENSKESKLRNQVSHEKNLLEDQVRDLKKHNLQIGQKWKEEARLKVRFDDLRKDAEEKINTLNSRISFLLNKIQTDEEARGSQNEEFDRMKLHADTLSEKNAFLERDTTEANKKIKHLEEIVRQTEVELVNSKIKLEALEQLNNEQQDFLEETKERENDLKSCRDNPLLAGGRLRFFIDHKPSLGVYTIKSKNVKDRQWLEKNNCNNFIKKACKSQNIQLILMQKVAETYGIIATRDEQIEELLKQSENLSSDVTCLTKQIHFTTKRLEIEEESKRRTLIKYINAVKASVSLGEPGCENNREEVGRIGEGRIHLFQVSKYFLNISFFAHGYLTSF